MSNFIFEIPVSNGSEIIQKYLKQIYEDTKDWDCEGINTPWFRGQSDSLKPPLPGVFRKEHKKKNGDFDEFWLTTTFRNRASNFGITPDNRNDIDKWLFLMQHVGLPTRLLDWSESALVSLFIAVYGLKEDKVPAVWMINPIALNHISLGINPTLDKKILKENHDVFPNTWVDEKPALENIRLAFKHPHDSLAKHNPTYLPLAIQLTYCHERMSVQKGCFTVYGLAERNFEELFDNNSSLVQKGYFKKYTFPKDKTEEIYKELQKLAITQSIVFPDLYGLAEELKDRFFKGGIITKKDKLEKISNLKIKTETIVSNDLQGLHQKYQDFLSKKMKEDNFYKIERTDFSEKEKKFYFHIGYWEKEIKIVEGE